MKFTKMQGIGNDYLYFFEEPPINVKELSIRLSDRHFGIGSDGLIYISKSKIADFRMRIFHADGSEAKMCGNGIRCVAKYVYMKGYTDKTKLKIETESGIREIKLDVKEDKVVAASVNMGKAIVSDSVTAEIDGMSYSLHPVSVGNPH
ncbi:MAG: diaminopimelate epimerase, partial [Solobacterium sp.]|nr:diaminopimelate epimerase [Solobacterium sp.]